MTNKKHTADGNVNSDNNNDYDNVSEVIQVVIVTSIVRRIHMLHKYKS